MLSIELSSSDDEDNLRGDWKTYVHNNWHMSGEEYQDTMDVYTIKKNKRTRDNYPPHTQVQITPSTAAATLLKREERNFNNL